MMENPQRQGLKIRKFSNPEKTIVTQRYVIEDKEDLELTLEAFPQLANNFMNVAGCWETAIDNGYIVLVTDEHPMSGYPTYCHESPQGSTHSNSLIRVQ